jgi:hypothetical protein
VNQDGRQKKWSFKKLTLFRQVLGGAKENHETFYVMIAGLLTDNKTQIFEAYVPMFGDRNNYCGHTQKMTGRLFISMFL